MTTHDDNYADARETMASRDADLAELWRRIDAANPFADHDEELSREDAEEAEPDAEEAERELDEYPLSLEWHRGRVRLIYGTGGPHDELSWAQTLGGEVHDLRYVYLPWFDRIELTDIPGALRRHAEQANELLRDVGVSHLSGYDEDDPHNGGTLTCDECGEELDDEGEPTCNCGADEDDEGDEDDDA